MHLVDVVVSGVGRDNPLIRKPKTTAEGIPLLVLERLRSPVESSAAESLIIFDLFLVDLSLDEL